MAKGRSPNYPQLTINEALDRIKKIYAKEHTHVAPKDVVVQHLGYSGLNGASLTMLATLRRYGLLEPQGEGLRVSGDAVTLLELPFSDPQYKVALNRVLFAPALFAELRSTHGSAMPSDANLRHALILKGYSSKAADEIIRVYRENILLADFSSLEYSDAISNDAHKESDVSQVTEDRQHRPDHQSQSSGRIVKTYPMDISNSRNVRAELLVYGELTKEDVAKLQRQIERQLESIRDGFDAD